MERRKAIVPSSALGTHVTKRVKTNSFSGNKGSLTIKGSPTTKASSPSHTQKVEVKNAQRSRSASITQSPRSSLHSIVEAEGEKVHEDEDKPVSGREEEAKHTMQMPPAEQHHSSRSEVTSSSEESDEYEDLCRQPDAIKPPRTNFEWQFVAKHRLSAKVYLARVWEKGERWTAKYSRPQFKYTVYSCSYPECSAQLKIISMASEKDNNSGENEIPSSIVTSVSEEHIIEIFSCFQHSNHPENPEDDIVTKEIPGIHEEVKQLIMEKNWLFLKPNKIVTELNSCVKNKELMPTYRQLTNYLYRMKIKVFKENFLETTAEFLKYQRDHEFASLLSPELLFCLHAKIMSESFIFVLSSRGSLENIRKQALESGQPSFFHIDATYKLMQNGYLLLTMSTEDPRHRGRLIAVAISLHENTAAYVEFITSIRDHCRNSMAFIWEPRFILSDGAESIHSAVSSVFPSACHLLCYFHLKKAIKRRIQSTKNSASKAKLMENERLILYGIDLMHKTQSREEFESLWGLLKYNWSKSLKLPEEFISYFDVNYVFSPLLWTISSAFKGKEDRRL